jgi:hypothetical protein
VVICASAVILGWFFVAHGGQRITHLELDGKVLPIRTSCMAFREGCVPSSARNTVYCNVGGNEIEVVLDYGTGFLFTYGGITWARAREDTPTGVGKVENFDPKKGVEVDVWFNDQIRHDRHHLVGSVSCNS